MVRISTLILSIAFLLWGGASYAASFEDGVEAHKRGDFSNALRIFRLVAEQGDPTAQYNLGAMYHIGEGVLQDYKEALKWYRMSADQGIASAQFNLGLMYSNGEGVPQDYKEALKWYRMSAEQGNAKAQFNLGLMYSNGNGVPQDDVYAHMWWNISGSNGHEQATNDRDLVAKAMTKEQIAEAQKFAGECVKKNYKDC